MGLKIGGFHCLRLERFVKNKHSSLRGPFISYSEMKCCKYDSVYWCHFNVPTSDESLKHPNVPEEISVGNCVIIWICIVVFFVVLVELLHFGVYKYEEWEQQVPVENALVRAPRNSVVCTIKIWRLSWVSRSIIDDSRTINYKNIMILNDTFGVVIMMPQLASLIDNLRSIIYDRCMKSCNSMTTFSIKGSV